MKNLDFEALAAHAIESVFAFAEFTKRAEHLFDQTSDTEALEEYRSAWLELEIVNATALDEWETDGRPETWDIKWKKRFLKDAEETVCLVRAAAQQLAD